MCIQKIPAWLVILPSLSSNKGSKFILLNYVNFDQNYIKKNNSYGIKLASLDIL